METALAILAGYVGCFFLHCISMQKGLDPELATRMGQPAFGRWIRRQSYGGALMMLAIFTCLLHYAKWWLFSR